MIPYRVLLLVLLLGMRPSTASAIDALPPFDDINGFLGTSARSDLIGPEMWTATMRYAQPEGNEKAFYGGQIPFQAWAPPQPGLNGQLHLTHQTEFVDLIRLELAECQGADRAVLRLVPTRNLWTPARLTTYYRSAPNSLGTDFPRSGSCGIRETKCITPDNVFVAELEITNYSPQPRTFAWKLLVGLPNLEKGQAAEYARLSGPMEFTTTAAGKTVSRKSFAAALAAPDFATQIELAPWQGITLRYGFTLDGRSAEAACDRLASALNDESVFDANIEHFNAWYRRNVPTLLVGDFDLLKMYYYRWFVVYRNLHDARRLISDHEYPRSAMYESPMGGWYNCVIGLSVPMQIQEAAWLRNPQPGWNQILNWVDNVPGYRDQIYIQYTPMAVWNFYKNHPDRDKLARTFETLKEFSLQRIGGQFERLPVQVGSWGTGAEYQPNFYQFTTPPWDYRNDCELLQSEPGLTMAKLIRLDTAGYAIGNLRAVGLLAGLLAMPDEQKRFGDGAEKLLAIIKQRHWDSRLGLFLAADPETGKLADQAACYDSFVPYMWGMIDEPEYAKAFDKLFDPAWFWDDFPVSTVAKNCPMYFDNAAEVGPAQASLTKPHNYGCSWNGPAWNYANSLIAESLGQVSLRRPELRAKWLDFFVRWCRMQFLYGDCSTPYTSEHHRPGDGARVGGPSEYFHSAWIDPFVSYWCGIRMDDDLRTVRFDPFTADEFTLARVPLAGREYTFRQQVSPSASGSQRVLSICDAQGNVLANQTGAEALVLDLR